jgi:signal transduction histidine kinase
LYGVVYDITDQKKSELELQNLLNITREQNKRLQNFAYIVSHNIRSHSANIVGLMEVYKDAVDHEDKDLFFKMMGTSTDKLSETIDNLNEIITIQADNEKEKRGVNLKLEIEKTCGAINSIILQTNAQVENHVEEHLSIQTVPSYLESILLNLLSNSIKYRSPGRQCIVNITAQVAGKYVVLSIQDNGVGIDLERYGSKLFGMYKTFHNNKDARGIGLFITKNQIEAMNGRIEVQSQVNEGSVFKVFLPMASGQL